MNPMFLDELCEGLQKGTFSSEELVSFCIDRVALYDDALGSFLVVNEEQALLQAKASDRRRRQGEELSALDGVPIGLKDIFVTQGVVTTCASRILEGYVPPFDSTVARRLKESGAILLGKLNMDEFAMGSSNEYSAYRLCRNPWDLQRTPGGSSGGCGAALAASLVPGCVGSDTGGSIRQPAAFCGVTGLKPTYGRVSRWGQIAFASSLDQAGPMARDAAGCARLLQCIAGKDRRDATSLSHPVPKYRELLEQLPDFSGLRVGIPSEYWALEIDSDTRRFAEQALEIFCDAGATCVEVSLPHFHVAVATYTVLAMAEAASNLARYDGVRFGLQHQEGGAFGDALSATRGAGFGEEVQRRLILGTFVLSADQIEAYVHKAQQVRTLISQDFQRAFQVCDVLATPTTPGPAFLLGTRNHEPLSMYMQDVFTLSANLSGIPAISFPVGFTSTQLPTGLQLMAPAFDEEQLLQWAHFYQQHTDWHKQTPSDAFMDSFLGGDGAAS